MVKIEQLIRGVRKFSQENCLDNSSYNKNVEKGQSAKILVISCADSLVDPISLMGASTGELFVHRNIAGIAPPFTKENQNNARATSAVLDYAINNLDVDDIIIMGHGHCGGIKALIQNDFENKKNSFAESWLEIIRPHLKKVYAKSHDKTPDKQRNLCEKEAIKISLDNLQTFPFVKEKLEKKELRIHGWHFDRGIFSIFKNNNWEVGS